MTWRFSVAIGALALATAAAQAQTIDGTVDGSYGAALFTQTIQTGFGDSNTGAADVANGSEIDGFYGQISGGKLSGVITGNLESNYNHLAIFIDTGSGGYNTLPSDNAFTGDFGFFNSLSGTKFDSGFNASYAIDIRNGGNSGNDTAPTTLYADVAQLGSTGTAYLDGVNATGAAGTAHVINDASGISIALNNSNVAGVTGGTAAASGAGVLTGAEFSIPLNLLGNPTGPIRIAAFVTGGNYVSNQVIGGLPVGTDNLGNTPIDFSGIAGNQFATVQAVPEPTTMAALALGVGAFIRRRKRR